MLNTGRRAGRFVSILVMLSTLGAGAIPDAAAQELTAIAYADPASLGGIPAREGASCGFKVVTFDITGVEVVHTLEVSLTMSYPTMGAYGASLRSPTGHTFALYTVNPAGTIGHDNPVADTYVFSDRGIGSWLNYAPTDPTQPVPGSIYRTLNGTTVTSIDANYAGDGAAGRWSVTFTNCSSSNAGQVTAASLFIAGTTGLVVNAQAGTTGAIPDGPLTTPQNPGPPRDVVFVVPPGRGPVTRVGVRALLTHTWVGDLLVRLIAPTGESHVIFGYTGATTPTSSGSRADLSGYYGFRDDSLGLSWWANAPASGGTVPAGRYRTSERGGIGATGAITNIDPVFAGLPSAGTWILRITDGAASDTGSIAAGRLTIETTPLPPTTRADAYATTYRIPLGVNAPGVLGNDSDNGVGPLRAELVAAPTHGALSLQTTGAFTYTPDVGFIGTDTFLYRAGSQVGNGAVAAVTIAVGLPATPPAPFELVASAITGQEVTLRWKVPPGPIPGDYVVEGGIAPGQTLGAVAAGGPQPTLTFPAPSGVFFLRVHAITNGQRSGPSNEIRVVVNVPEAPSPPALLTGFVNGNQLGLAWKNTFAGGEPQSLRLSVTGAVTGEIPLALGESFSVDGVPPGTYTFRVRALNATGASAESNPVALTSPTGCAGPPLTPSNFLAFALGNVVTVMWDPPVGGPAAMGYAMNVTGSFTGSLPTATRSFRAPAPSGTYAISVAAVNPCGASAPTAAQTVIVP